MYFKPLTKAQLRSFFAPSLKSKAKQDESHINHAAERAELVSCQMPSMYVSTYLHALFYNLFRHMFLFLDNDNK